MIYKGFDKKMVFPKLRTFLGSFIVIGVLLLTSGTNAYGWIFITEEDPQPPVLMIDTMHKNCPYDIYINHIRRARITTSYIMELKPETVYHLEIRCGRENTKLFESSMSLSMGKEVVVICRDKVGCTIDI